LASLLCIHLDVDQHTSNTSSIPLVGFAPSRSLPLLFEFASGYLIAEAGFDNSEVRLPSTAPFSPSDVGSLKPSALLLRGGTVSPPNLAVTHILQYHLTDMRLSKATKPQSTVAILTRNIELHSLGLLHSFQPYISEAECSTLPHVSSTRVPHLVPWPCCSVGQLPRESLGNSARTTCHRFATANHPCTSPRCARRGPATSSVEHSSPPSTRDITVVHHPAAIDQSALQPPGFIDLLSAPITTAFDHLPQDDQPPRHHRPNGRQLTCSSIRRLTHLPPVRLRSRLCTRLPFLALVSYSGLLKALGATSNHTSNEEQPLTLAAGGVAGVEPEDKEALGDSPAEEPTVVISQ
jgi:hypothetical protein